MTLPRSFFLSLLVLTFALPLAGCERTKEELGLSRRSPDEFSVLKRAPLEIPSDFSVLPPPRPGALRSQDTSAVFDAKAAIVGEDGARQSGSSSVSASETLLLQKTGASAASPDIRAVVDREAVDTANDKRSTVKKLLNLGKREEEGPATVVDAPAEMKRLKEGQKTETPTRDE